VAIEIGYAPAQVEERLLVAYTGCTAPLAKMLVHTATLSRAKAQTEDLTHGIGFRRLLAWAETLTDGIDPMLAFTSAILNTAPDLDREILNQLLLVAIDPIALKAALKGQTTAAPLPPSAAGQGFTPISSTGV